MKARKRYLLLILVFAFLMITYFGLRAISFNTQIQSIQIALRPADARSSLHQETASSYYSWFSTSSSSSSSVEQSGEAIAEKSGKEWKSKRRRSYLNGHDVCVTPVSSSPSHNHANRSVIWRPVYKTPSQGYPYRHHSNHAGRRLEYASNCRFSNCFDLSKCKPGEPLRVHIYPEESAMGQLTVSSTYQRILNVIMYSIHYEPDPAKACLFITRYDTLDRDPLSPDYQKNLPLELPLDNGKNHLVFNLYSGTWPDYNEHDFSGFNPGHAILAKASMSHSYYRPGFDISLPLFSRSHRERGNNVSVIQEQEEAAGNIHSRFLNINNFKTKKNSQMSIGEASNSCSTVRKKNLLVFKGKRYIYGIGSETRNTLHHLHNGEDVLIFTTCKHGKKWKDIKDKRCNRDNQNYDQHDYIALMKNSTFCLVPRGRRLGSFRFLEALSHGCIPVLLSNHWVKPFEEVIDWSQVLIEGDERGLLQLPDILRSIGWRRTETMRSQSLSIYETYFSSVEKIVLTTISILTERIQSELSLNAFMWNLVNPIVSYDRVFSTDLRDYPGYNSNQIKGFAVVVYINKAYSPSNMHRLLKSISKAQHASQVILLWALPMSPPPGLTKRITSSPAFIKLIVPRIKTINAKLYPYDIIETDAILSLDPESTLQAEELDFAYLVWLSFPHRIVGFTARDHNGHIVHSKWTNQYSIILLDAAFYHRYYSWYYTHHISSLTALNVYNKINKRDNADYNENNAYLNSGKINDLLLSDDICLDFMFNFMVSSLTKEGPIKVTQRKRTTDGYSSNSWTSKYDLLSTGQQCFNVLVNQTFGYIPLIKSQVRFDPLLFKDPVSNLRKKYRKLELVI